MKKEKQRIKKLRSRKFGLGILSLAFSMFYLTTTTVAAYESSLGSIGNFSEHLSLKTHILDNEKATRATYSQAMKATSSQTIKVTNGSDSLENKATSSDALLWTFYDESTDEAAHRTFKEPDSSASIEELYEVLDGLPDDYQNNERSYLQNMDTLGDELGLEDGEIREIDYFGGWRAISENGKPGKFAIGKKNEWGYFNGWRNKGNGVIEEGGMLGADALDNVYVHEQALDRTYHYMLMLVKGRTRANHDEEVKDGSAYDPRANKGIHGVDLKKLTHLERQRIFQYSPNVVGFNGIEKTFKAYSTKYGSRVRLSFVSGYISDLNGYRGEYHIVIKAQKEDGTEQKIYDQTIGNPSLILDNRELENKGLDIFALEKNFKDILIRELQVREKAVLTQKLTAAGIPDKGKLTDEQKREKERINKEHYSSVAPIMIEIDKTKLNQDNYSLKGTVYARFANDLNNQLKRVSDLGSDNPSWQKSQDPRAKSKDRVYNLIHYIMPTAKKITYYPDSDRLELETDVQQVKDEIKELEATLETADETDRAKIQFSIERLNKFIENHGSYKYLPAKNGETLLIRGSLVNATKPASAYNLSDAALERARSNKVIDDREWGANKDYSLSDSVSSSEEYGYFGNIVGTNQIERSEVISDEQLSNTIREALGEGDTNLGKGGNFSTGDIKLDKDVVSYTVQVMPGDDTRVGVNNQSHRIQYNEPILADFSILQDTLEPSKYVVRRILEKLEDDPKFPKDKLKKIKEEMDTPGINTTSKLKKLFVENTMGSVKVGYVDEEGNMLSDGYKTIVADANFATEYEYAFPESDNIIRKNNKTYKLTATNGGLREDSDPSKGKIFKGETVITYLYEEVPARAVVHIKEEIDGVQNELSEHKIILSGIPGEAMSAEQVNKKIKELEDLGYIIKENGFNPEVFDSKYEGDNEEPSQSYNIVIEKKIVDKPNEPKPDEPKPNEPKPDEPKPNEPKPDEPKPNEPKPDAPKPNEPKPDAPKPDEPKPNEPKPDAPKPNEPRPNEPKPDAPKPSEPRPNEPKPDEPKPNEPKPDEPKPNVSKPDEPKPNVPKPDAPKPNGSSNGSIPNSSVPSASTSGVPVESPISEVIPVPSDETKENLVNSNRILKKKDMQKGIPKTGDKGMDAMIKLSIVSILSVFGLLVLKFKKKETEEK